MQSNTFLLNMLVSGKLTHRALWVVQKPTSVLHHSIHSHDFYIQEKNKKNLIGMEKPEMQKKNGLQRNV